MWFLVAVLGLWGLTYSLGQIGDDVHPMVVWGVWTIALYVPGYTAMQTAFDPLEEKVCGVLGFTMFTLYMILLTDVYIRFLPTGPSPESAPDLWPTLYQTHPCLLYTSPSPRDS